MTRDANDRLLRALGLAAVVATGLSLVGCEDHRRLSEHAAVDLNDMTARHPIALVGRPQALSVELPPRGAGLSRDQVADLHRFLARYKAEATGPLTVSMGRTAGTYGGQSRVVGELGRLLHEAEIAPRRVRRSRHDDAGRGTGSIRLSFSGTVALPPVCGHWQRDVGVERDRVPYSEFGCATQRNLAGMVANARDLQRPQDEQPRAAERRSQTWSKYIAPEEKDGAGGAETKAKAVDTTRKQQQ